MSKWIYIFICPIFLIGGNRIAFSQPQFTNQDTIERTPLFDSAKLSAFVNQYVNEHLESFHVPGLVVVIVGEGETLLSKGYGFANLEEKTPMTPQTVIRAGSVSKPVTATAVIQLVERGKIDLHTPISAYINDINLEDRFGEASTVAHLLSHVAGYPDQFLLSHAPTKEDWKPLDQVLKSDLPARAMSPGKVMAYSSWDYALLGYTIEKVTGLPYERVISENLLEPLGMHRSSYLQPLPQEVFANLAIGYGYKNKEDKYRIIPHDFVKMSPGVALVTTGEDMRKYMLALLNGGILDSIQILKQESLAMILERQVSAHPYSRGRSYALSELTLSGRKVFYHDGNGIGFSSRIVLMPEYNLGIFLSTNHRSLSENLTSSKASTMLKNLSTGILENFTPKPTSEIPDVQPMPDAKERIGRYAGHYQTSQISRNDFFKLEALMDNVTVRDNGDGTLKIGSGNYEEVEPLVFQNKKSPSFFTVFVENDDREAAYLTFGGTGSYKKVKWYQHASFHMALFGMIGILFFSMLILWPFTRHGHWVAWVISLLNFIFLLGIGMLFGGGTDLLIFFKTMPMGTRFLFILPWVNGIMTLGLFFFVVQMWKDIKRSIWGKMHYTLFALASVVLFWLANYWNMILS